MEGLLLGPRVGDGLVGPAELLHQVAPKVREPGDLRLVAAILDPGEYSERGREDELQPERHRAELARTRYGIGTRAGAAGR